MVPGYPDVVSECQRWRFTCHSVLPSRESEKKKFPGFVKKSKLAISMVIVSQIGVELVKVQTKNGF